MTFNTRSPSLRPCLPGATANIAGVVLVMCVALGPSVSAQPPAAEVFQSPSPRSAPLSTPAAVDPNSVMTPDFPPLPPASAVTD